MKSSVTVDAEINETSTNPVQNRVIHAALAEFGRAIQEQERHIQTVEDDVSQLLSVVEEMIDAKMAGFFVVKGSDRDNVTVAAGARANFTMDIIGAEENYQIAGYKRVFLSNATTGGANRDKIALQSISTGGGGKQSNIAVINTGTEAAKIKIDVECFCIGGTLGS